MIGRPLVCVCARHRSALPSTTSKQPPMVVCNPPPSSHQHDRCDSLSTIVKLFGFVGRSSFFALSLGLFVSFLAFQPCVEKVTTM
mmetsp:Transcript_25249/g.45512  ORF Transcript_25249/g.45512 Transcript_25249/m.45512 type:complete len:85 (-) Transcript_25249:8-262(-)